MTRVDYNGDIVSPATGPKHPTADWLNHDPDRRPVPAVYDEGWVLVEGFAYGDKGVFAHVTGEFGLDEKIGGELENYIRQTPGYYVPLPLTLPDEQTGDPEVVGWILAYHR